MKSNKNHPPDEAEQFNEVVDMDSVYHNDDYSIEKDGDNDFELAEGDSCESRVKKLKKQIKFLTKEKSDYLLGWQKARADLVNTSKRLEQEKANHLKWANAGLMSDLIPVLDSFDMAMANKEVWESVDKNWRIGVEYIKTQIDKVLADYGLEKITPTGELFSPDLHEAVEELDAEDASLDHRVSSVKQVGYMLDGKLIRPAKVAVFAFKKKE